MTAVHFHGSVNMGIFWIVFNTEGLPIQGEAEGDAGE
jgi:hypothetical protein